MLSGGDLELSKFPVGIFATIEGKCMASCGRLHVRNLYVGTPCIIENIAACSCFVPALIEVCKGGAAWPPRAASKAYDFYGILSELSRQVPTVAMVAACVP